MGPKLYPGQLSSMTTLRPKRLLDLPDEILSQILELVVAPSLIYSTDAVFTPRDASIGLTCVRLYRLVKPRLQTLDFVYPNPITGVSRVPERVSNNIEAFVRMSYPYVETLRLPTDFWTEKNVMTLLQPCKNLRELSFSMNTDVLMDQARVSFMNLQNLRILTVHYPPLGLLKALAFARPRLTDLTLISVYSSERTLQFLEDIFHKFSALKSLTLSFYRGVPGRRDGIAPTRRLEREQNFCSWNRRFRAIIFTDVIERLCGCMPLGAPAPRKLSFLGRLPESLPNDDIRFMKYRITQFAKCINHARDDAFINPPDLDIPSLCLSPHDRTFWAYEGMNALICASTEVLVHFANTTVLYPAMDDKNSTESCPYPKPVMRSFTFGAKDSLCRDEFRKLKSCADLRLESLTLRAMKNVNELLELEELTYLLRANNLQSIELLYKIETVEDIKRTMQFLLRVTGLAPGVCEITLPSNMVNKSDAVTVNDLKMLKCAGSLSLLRLHNEKPTKWAECQHDILYEELHFRLDGPFSDPELQKFILELPRFLNMIQNAFPKLTQLHVTPMSFTVANIDLDLYRASWEGIKRVIKAFEKASGIDASSLRMVLGALAEIET